MHTLHNKQCTARCHWAEGGFNLSSVRSRGRGAVCAGAGGRCGDTHLSALLGSSSEELPLQMLPKEWLGFSLGSSHSKAGSLFFLLPKSFLKGWNLPALFLSADERTERRGAEAAAGGRTPRQRAQRRSGVKERGSSPEQPGPRHGNAGLLLAADASHWQSKGRSAQTSLLLALEIYSQTFGSTERVILQSQSVTLL